VKDHRILRIIEFALSVPYILGMLLLAAIEEKGSRS